MYGELTSNARKVTKAKRALEVFREWSRNYSGSQPSVPTCLNHIPMAVEVVSAISMVDSVEELHVVIGKCEKVLEAYGFKYSSDRDLILNIDT